MVQAILVGVIFLAALIYLGRFIYKQASTGKNDAYCEKCLPNDHVKNANSSLQEDA